MPELLVTLFLCGDVMLGRGIDQILPHAVDPTLHESHVKDARTYVRLAERASGPIGAPVSYRELWGDALDILQQVDPTVRLINLETSITTNDAPWPTKGIHYRMHPANIGALEVAKVDACVLANNHVLDWGRPGLLETLATLREAGIAAVGAGADTGAARAPAIVGLGAGRRVLVFAYGLPSSGVPPAWAAGAGQPGVSLLEDLGERAFEVVARSVDEHAGPRDIVVVSLHWGRNWGYAVPNRQKTFARRLIDEAGVDIVHGHSSHHPRGIEVHGGRLILYGCGDLINDYEGIGGHERFRPELALMYFPTVDAAGVLQSLRMVPVRVHRMRLERADAASAEWLRKALNRASEELGTEIGGDSHGMLTIRWR
jgi:poly-gamma-glutamate synthesis protein (capsule biosynthesis protein)